MTNIIRRYPYSRNAMRLSRLIDPFFDMEDNLDESQPFSVPLDVVEKDEEYQVRASVAGIDPEKIQITYENNTMTIQGETSTENEQAEEGKYYLRERRFGSFCRSITMPGMVDQAGISAEIENGVLTVSLPKKPEAQPKRIEVKAKSVKVIDQNEH